MGTLEGRAAPPLFAWLDYAEAGRPLPGQAVSGDACLVRQIDGAALLAVCDGLGHGPDAARASSVALAVLREAQAGNSLSELIECCHAAMQHTRGAALSLALLDAAAGTLAWTGIGNVDAVLLRADGTAAALLCRGGVVGYRMPAPRVEVRALAAGDLIVFATDGISSRFPAEVERGAPPATVARTVLERCGKPGDDALVLAARLLRA